MDNKVDNLCKKQQEYSESIAGLIFYVFRSILMLGIFSFFIIEEVKFIFRVVLFNNYFLGIFELIAIILFVIFTINDFSIYIKKKKQYRLVFSILGCMLIFIGLAIKGWDIKRHSESTKYTAVFDLTENKYLEFKFRENGNVLLDIEEEDGLVSNYYYGSYQLINNIIRVNYLFGREWKYATFKLEKNKLYPLFKHKIVRDLPFKFQQVLK